LYIRNNDSLAVTKRIGINLVLKENKNSLFNVLHFAISVLVQEYAKIHPIISIVNNIYIYIYTSNIRGISPSKNPNIGKYTIHGWYEK